jgi:Domain of unknown function (DUF6458)
MPIAISLSSKDKLALVMTIGTSLFLIAVGAILKFAVKADLSGIKLSTVGLILMVAGVLGLLISLFFTIRQNDHRVR